MKNNTSEPPGRQSGLKLARRTSVIKLPQDSQIATAIAPAVQAQVSGDVVYHSVDAMVHSLRPATPVHCLRPATVESTA